LVGVGRKANVETAERREGRRRKISIIAHPVNKFFIFYGNSRVKMALRTR
jgi:hypothetical protein